MPFDDRSRRALAALERPRAAFHSAVVAAVDELRALLASHRAPESERGEQEAARLGVFGAGRIDMQRFASVVAAPAAIDPARLERLEQALALLTEFAQRGDALYLASVPRGADLRNAVRSELAARGSVFRTAHEVELVRSGETLGPPHGDTSLYFRHWRRSERDLAPPLVVHVEGPDLNPAGLADFMDGAQKIVLLVAGPAPAAPLARLIAPRTFVTQVGDPADLKRFGDYDGPGIAAVLPEGTARFTYDPSRGATLAQRLTVELLPESAPRAIAGGSLRQQNEELAWLAELAQLATATAPAVVEAVTEPEAAPADQLAGWLLRMASEPAGS
jgi:hypothetical protein